MKTFYSFLFIVFASACLAGDVDEMRNVLEANFEACNNEDVAALMATCSVDMPRRDEFRRESAKLWEEKDIYYRLIRFKVLEIEGDYAIASVVQTTFTKDRSSNSNREEFVRNGTGLLTKSECVEYKVAFKKDGRRWKCYLTLTEPVEYDADN
jgi:hypothetical protein